MKLDSSYFQKNPGQNVNVLRKGRRGISTSMKVEQQCLRDKMVELGTTDFYKS